MTLEIKIALVILGLYFAWSVFAAIRMIRSSREAARAACVREYIESLDQLRYSDFERTKQRACCIAIARAVNEWDMSHLDLSENHRMLDSILLNYCPQCGKKIEKTKTA